MPGQQALTPETLEGFPDIQIYSSNGQSILLNRHYPVEIDAAVFSQEYWESKNAITGSASGRGTTLFISHQGFDLILRKYLRGGLPGKLFTDQYWFTGYQNSRAWQEFVLLEQLLQLGLPVPRPVAAQINRQGLICRNHIIVERIPGADDLHSILSQKALNVERWQRIGATIKTFHQKQVYHHDLNIRNIMLDDKQQTWLIDFDRCQIRSGESWKQDNIARLRRSFLKEKNKNSTLQWQEKDWQALLAGYNE